MHPSRSSPSIPPQAHFGTSVKRKKVKFASFLEMLQDPSDQGKWYLTTQYVDETEQQNNAAHDNEPELDPVLPSPTDALSNDFPARPALLGNLVPSAVQSLARKQQRGQEQRPPPRFSRQPVHPLVRIQALLALSALRTSLPPSTRPRRQGPPQRPHRLCSSWPAPLLHSRPSQATAAIRPDGLVPSDAARWRRNARLRIKRDIDERAAADAGEGSRSRSQRKGKAKQTRAQELAEEALLQAEAELRICQMDEDGIDPEADTSDDAYDEDDDSEDQADLDGLLGIFADPKHTQAGQSSEEDDGKRHRRRGQR
ncbi:hypothetical protein L1887_62423 [Cichorium endivia]|nr:hypothetical protein L1887_62423 [Cichorium endivia]